MSLATITYDDEGGTPAQKKVAMSNDLASLPASAEGPWSLMWMLRGEPLRGINPRIRAREGG